MNVLKEVIRLVIFVTVGFALWGGDYPRATFWVLVLIWISLDEANERAKSGEKAK